MSIKDISEILAWRAAYRAFKQAVGSDTNIKLQYTIAWAATINAVLAFNKVINRKVVEVSNIEAEPELTSGIGE